LFTAACLEILGSAQVDGTLLSDETEKAEKAKLVASGTRLLPTCRATNEQPTDQLSSQAIGDRESLVSTRNCEESAAPARACVVTNARAVLAQETKATTCEW